MAERFGCDLEAVERTARQLGTVATEMRTFGSRGDEYAAAMRSRTIQRAIRDFEDDSSDHRSKVVEAVESLKKLLAGLVEGCRTVDRELNAGLTEMDKSLDAFTENSKGDAA